MDDIILSSDSCVYLPENETVAVSDLHLGFELSMEEKGVFLPRLQAKIEMERMSRIIDRYAPRTILINGDLKHDFSRNSPQEWIEIKRLFELLSASSSVVVVKGNHDNYILSIASKFGIKTVSYFLSGDILLAHGDVDVGIRARKTVIGHEHPVIRVRDSVGAQFRFPVFLFLRSRGVLVLPAFSPFSVGTDVVMESGEFMSPYLSRIDAEDAFVFAIDGASVRKMGSIADIRNTSSGYDW